MDKNLEVRLVKNRKELDNVMKIREIVFIREQKVPKGLEADGLDKLSKHVIVFYKNKPIGCARIRIIGKKAKLERIALLKGYRGRGFGNAIVNYLIKYCKSRKFKNIFMNSSIISWAFMAGSALSRLESLLWKPA